MNKTFIEMKVFQVKPDKLASFEAMIAEMSANQLKCDGCISLKYFKRFFTIDGIELGEPPRELTKVVYASFHCRSISRYPNRATTARVQTV